MKEEWLFRGALVPIDAATTAALVAEIKRLIDVVGGMALAQPEHEPVHSVQSNGRHSPLLTHMMNKRTTQPKRPWVGLTDEEMDKWIEEEHDVLRWAEAKLKEKNT